MTDCHLHITASNAPCRHYKIALHRTSNDKLLGTLVFTRQELEEELSEFDSAKERVIAQIIGIALGNKNKTPAQLKTILEAAVIRI